ncbi:hypothetical protein [Ruegeria faecimaris]|uniref:hypothetical protein n=1 Tax=Ruegeria faecimaris TaxID=686389 RepID=UPI0023300952|nr:hypothetical protein [Ruegeria faecimaris]
MSDKLPQAGPFPLRPIRARKRYQIQTSNTRPIYPNQYQPKRGIIDQNGEALSFRTYISFPDSQYDLFDLRNIICQTLLYRWVKSEFVNGTPIADLHGYLFWDHPTVTKRQLGSTILQAVTYDPRKLKAQTKANPKACMTYVFHNPKDLEYGLEWMICIWIRRVTLANSTKEVEEALTELSETNSEDLASLFWEPMMQPVVRETIRDFDWEALWERHELVVQQRRVIVKPRPVLRSFL